jgi:hypothetical protein
VHFVALCYIILYYVIVCRNSYCTIQINHQPDATIFQFIILTFIYSSTCFGRSPARHQELNDCSSSLWFYLHIVVTAVLCSWSGRPAVLPASSLFLNSHCYILLLHYTYLICSISSPRLLFQKPCSKSKQQGRICCFL